MIHGTERLPNGLISPGLKFFVAAGSGLVLALAPIASDPFGSLSLLKPYLPASAHQAYVFRLIHDDSAHATLGQLWLRQSEQALLEPKHVSAPFETTVDFTEAESLALGYEFSVESGKRIEVDLELEGGDETLKIFVDLYRIHEGLPEYVLSAAPAAFSSAESLRRRLELESLQDAEYVLRVQAELQNSGHFTLSIRTVPTLEFPVDGYDTRAILSGFGADRDGGTRAHHGVDIFAPRGTPVLASVDARVSRVDTTGIGGNVVWLQPLFGNLRLYYAHLDSQSVKPGQYVFAGEPIGTVGNTGNARTTPPHLHFGVYVRRRGGAWDPYPFL